MGRKFIGEEWVHQSELGGLLKQTVENLAQDKSCTKKYTRTNTRKSTRNKGIIERFEVAPAQYTTEVAENTTEKKN